MAEPDKAYRVRINGEFFGVFYAKDEQGACDRARFQMDRMPDHQRKHIQIISAKEIVD